MSGFVEGKLINDNTNKSTSHNIVAIYIYGYTITPGQSKLELESGYCRNIRWKKIIKIKNDGYKPVTFTINEITFSREDVASLEKIIQSAERQLRNFNPKLSWFRGKYAPPDWLCAMAIKWEDRELVIGIPHPDMLSNTPQYAKEAYKALEMVRRQFGKIRTKYSKNIQKLEITCDDKRAKEFDREFKYHKESSLPKGRRGW